MGRNADRARESLEQLSAVSGPSGVAQRGMKQAYMKAERAGGYTYSPDASRLADAGAPAGAPVDRFGLESRAQGMAGMGGMMGGMLGDATRRRRAHAPALGAPAAAGMMAGEGQAGPSPEATIRRVGEKTFYLKDRRWVDSAVKPEEDAKAKLVRQFSDAYFDLARSQGAELNQYLAFTEPVVVRLGAEVYRIEPAADDRP
jgi:Ca-activated chloride channel family protein